MLIYPLHYPTFLELHGSDNLTRAKPIYLSNLCKQYRYASFEQLQDLVLKPSSYFLFLLRFLGWCEVSRMHSQRNDWWKVRFRWKLNSWYSTTRFSSPSTKTNSKQVFPSSVDRENCRSFTQTSYLTLQEDHYAASCFNYGSHAQVTHRERSEVAWVKNSQRPLLLCARSTSEPTGRLHGYLMEPKPIVELHTF